MENSKQIEIRLNTVILIIIILVLLVIIGVMGYKLKTIKLDVVNQKLDNANIEINHNKEENIIKEDINNSIDKEKVSDDNIEYKDLTEVLWEELKQEQDDEGNEKYHFMTKNVKKNSDNTYTIQGAIYELFERCTQHQGAIYTLNEELGYYQITIPYDFECTEILSENKISIQEYYKMYKDVMENKDYSDIIFANGGANFVFEDGVCIEYQYDGK